MFVLKICFLNALYCLSRNLSNWFHFAFLCDFDVTFKPHNKSSFRCVRLNGLQYRSLKRQRHYSS